MLKELEVLWAANSSGEYYSFIDAAGEKLGYGVYVFFVKCPKEGVVIKVGQAKDNDLGIRIRNQFRQYKKCHVTWTTLDKGDIDGVERFLNESYQLHQSLGHRKPTEDPISVNLPDMPLQLIGLETVLERMERDPRLLEVFKTETQKRKGDTSLN